MVFSGETLVMNQEGISSIKNVITTVPAFNKTMERILRLTGT
jgi:hypothetical protein